MPAEAVSPVSSKMRARISFAVANAVLQAAQVCGHVEIGFVERERLDQRRVVGEDGVDLARDGAVDVEPRRHEHQFRALPHGGGRRHGRAHAERARLVARRGHHAALGAVANRHRPAAQLRVVALLDRRIERVHVDVDDLATAACRPYQAANTARTIAHQVAWPWRGGRLSGLPQCQAELDPRHAMENQLHGDQCADHPQSRPRQHRVQHQPHQQADHATRAAGAPNPACAGAAHR